MVEGQEEVDYGEPYPKNGMSSHYQPGKNQLEDPYKELKGGEDIPLD